MTRFAYPELGWLLLLPVLVYYLLPAVKKLYGDALRVPFVADILQIKENSGHGAALLTPGRVSFGKVLLWSCLWGLVVAALCRPQWVGEPLRVKNEGRDILLVVDISNSMNERDFQYQNKMYDRLTAVKNVVSQFIDQRAEDRMGLVLFGTRAYLQVPLTYDKQSLKEVLWATDAGMAGKSTAIGDAVGVALKNLAADNKDAASKVIILLTDGENNDGSLSLPQAIALAKDENVKVYTIGAGSDSTSFFGGLFSLPAQSGIDEEGLQQLADETKGSYFRAKDVNSLAAIYAEINKLEPQEQNGRFVQETKDLFYYPAGAALILFMLLAVFSRKVW